jgi:hypothetical protein
MGRANVPGRLFVCPCVIACSGLGLLVSCHKSKDAGHDVAAPASAPAAGAETPATTAPETTASEQPAEKTEPLPQSSLDEIAKSCVLIQIPGQPNGQGVILEAAKATSSNHEYLVLCGAPREPDLIRVAYQTPDGLEIASAKKKTSLPSGMALYGFLTKFTLVSSHPVPPSSGETLHAFRLAGDGSLTAEKRAALTAELATLQEQIKQNQKEQAAMAEQLLMQARPDRNPNRGDQRTAYQVKQELKKTTAEASRLALEESRLGDVLRFPVNSLAVAETAAAATRDHLERAGGGLDNTLLATSTNTIQAIRHHGKWIDLQDVRAALSNQISAVTLHLSGSQTNIDLSCEIELLLPAQKTSLSAVAITTFELESLGSGTLEERLARVPPVALEGQRDSWRIPQRQMPWNAQKTTLWIKVFNDKEPAKLLLDEVILLSYADSFSARWGKPPSPLITLPAPIPNEPADLVKEQVTLDAKGAIRDIVAAGDGSILMIQTDHPPYWAPLDLKTGQWTDPPWKATADTLLATQAGHIYLIDRKTGVLEIWDPASGKRTGMQLLPVEGVILAAAAPLSDPDQPLLIATAKNAWFVDPGKFEVVPSGLDVQSCFEATDRRADLPKLDPASVWLRASHDGTLYSLSGTTVKPSAPAVATVRITLDRTATVVTTGADSSLIPSRGRYLSRNYPDHGGKGTILEASRISGGFPGSPGKLQFIHGLENNNPYAVLNTLPVMPWRNDTSSMKPLPDRGVYFDSVNRVLLLPDNDKLNFLRVSLPEQEKLIPAFVLPGEEVEIPLPPGTGHKLTADIGGEVVIGKSSIKWTAPRSSSGRESTLLKLEWTGELGSQISRNYSVKITSPPMGPLIESPDGSRKRPLIRRGVLRVGDHGLKGFAGSGFVALSGGDKVLEAWSLGSCEKIFSQSLAQSCLKFIGDAERLYVLGREGKLTSYDLHTGESLGEEEPGKGIIGIWTGMAANIPLLAVERDGDRPFLTQIHQDTLKSAIVDLPADTQRKFYSPDFRSNASGSAIWSSQVLILRDKKAITVKTFNDIHISNGCPDASGRYIVCNDSIVDLGVTPPKQTRIALLPGMTISTACKFDESGRYLMFINREENSSEEIISVRDVRDPAKELFRLRHAMEPHIISDSKSLVLALPSNSLRQWGVFEFDIPAIVREFSR